MERPPFTYVEELTAPGDETTFHVVDHDLQTILSRGWQDYVALMREASGSRPAPVVRKITTTFEAECRGGERLILGVRAGHRTRRSLVLEEELWSVRSDRAVVTSSVVIVTIDRDLGRSVAVPDDLREAIERFEGRPLELKVTA